MNITFSPHTDIIRMYQVVLHPGEVTRLRQLVSLYQSWRVRDTLYLYYLGGEDWSELTGQCRALLTSSRSQSGTALRRSWR